MGLPASRWYVFHFLLFAVLVNILQTSMHVPEPVISLAIKPQGQETPNFARALNRFRKEDPTFKIHFDKDSKEVNIIPELCRPTLY